MVVSHCDAPIPLALLDIYPEVCYSETLALRLWQAIRLKSDSETNLLVFQTDASRDGHLNAYPGKHLSREATLGVQVVGAGRDLVVRDGEWRGGGGRVR